MSKNTFQTNSDVMKLIIVFAVSVLFIAGCGLETVKTEVSGAKSVERNVRLENAESELSNNITKISITPNSPADTVRVFYKNLREQHFREAMLLTNLRPAIEGLTEDELKELQIDFAPLANQIPADVAINGEIISGSVATVTVKLPDNETDKLDLQEIRLRKDKDVWVIMTVDEATEKVIAKEGKNYFFTLKIATHHEEAKAMLKRIDKAQMVYSMQNRGQYGNIAALVEKGFLPDDILTADSTGYVYDIQLTAEKNTFKAVAEPAVYGKTGKLTYWFEVNPTKKAILQSKDFNGKLIDDKK